MPSNLESILDSVADEKSFLVFLQALAEDWDDEHQQASVNPGFPYGPGANGWENDTIGAFLQAAVSWGEVSGGGLECYATPNNPWTRAAQIIYMGKIYE